MDIARSLQSLQCALDDELPGLDAQKLLAPAARKLYPAPELTPKQAGVLIVLYPEAGHLHFPMIVRPSHNKLDKHRGQISFPGGKIEEGDEGDLTQTALREAEEEIGVQRSEVRVLGTLTDLYVPVSNFVIHPVVGYLDHKPDWIIQESEVERVLELSIAELLDPATLQRKSITSASGATLPNVPHFAIGGRVVWGASAMILSEFLEMARRCDWV